MRRGIELGAFLIDTAEVYGTEDVTGQAIKGIRDRVFIATKVSGAHLRHDEVLRAAEWPTKLKADQRCAPVTYTHQNFPKWKYHRTEPACTVDDAEQEAALGDGWVDTPTAFEAELKP